MFGIADSYDESAELSVQIDYTQGQAFVLLDVLSDNNGAAGIYLDSEHALALARELTALALSGVMRA